jgi:F-type H+-transporting ATPase subunit delta
VTLKTIARRYAIALFDVLQKTGDQGRAEQDLEALRAVLHGNAELAKVFENPAVPASKKRAIVEALLTAAGEVSPEVRRLLLMLAERDRLALLPDVADAYAERLRKLRHVVTAELTTAMPLPDSQRASLVAALGKAAGSHVALTEKIDPSIIGGVIARVGSVVFDGSVLTQIERMRRRLIDAGDSSR